MPDGETFEDLAGFKQLVLNQQRNLARNVAEKLVVYGTGATIHFADREEIEACVDRTEERDFGFRSLLKAVVTSDLFLKK